MSVLPPHKTTRATLAALFAAVIGLLAGSGSAMGQTTGGGGGGKLPQPDYFRLLNYAPMHIYIPYAQFPADYDPLKHPRSLRVQPGGDGDLRKLDSVQSLGGLMTPVGIPVEPASAPRGFPGLHKPENGAPAPGAAGPSATTGP